MIDLNYKFKGANVVVINSKLQLMRIEATTLIEGGLHIADKIDIAVDQSTSAVGITVDNAETDETVAMFQLTLPKYNKDFNPVIVETVIHSLAKDSEVRYFIMEDTFGGKNQYTFKILSQLQGLLKGLKNTAPEFYNCSIKTILPTSWRSGFITEGTQGKGRKENKIRVVKECERRLGDVTNILNISSPDYDVLESYGIMKGWKSKNFNSSGNIKINKTMKGTVNNWTMFIVNENPVDYLKNLYGKEYREFDTELSLEETVPRIAKNFGTGFFKVSSSDYPWIALKLNKELHYEDIIYAFCGSK